MDKEEGERLKERIAKKQSKAGLRDINLEQYRYTRRSYTHCFDISQSFSLEMLS